MGRRFGKATDNFDQNRNESSSQIKQKGETRIRGFYTLDVAYWKPNRIAFGIAYGITSHVAFPIGFQYGTEHALHLETIFSTAK